MSENKTQLSNWIKDIVAVHELVHYRWKSFQEGREQWLRMHEILAGRRFDPPKEEKTPSPKPNPSPIIQINPKLGPWIESYLSVYR